MDRTRKLSRGTASEQLMTPARRQPPAPFERPVDELAHKARQSREDSAPRDRAAPLSLLRSPGDVRRALLLREVLGPPRAIEPYDYGNGR